MVIGGVFRNNEEFTIYMNWIKENGYTYNDSFRDDLIKQFLDLYRGE